MFTCPFKLDLLITLPLIKGNAGANSNYSYNFRPATHDHNPCGGLKGRNKSMSVDGGRLFLDLVIQFHIGHLIHMDLTS